MNDYKIQYYNADDDTQFHSVFECNAEDVSHAIQQCRGRCKNVVITSVVEQNRERQEVFLSNGKSLSVVEVNDGVAIGYVDGSGDDWWIATISANGVLVAPNSSTATADLTDGCRSVV